MPNVTDLLTEDEHLAVTLLAKAANQIGKVIGTGPQSQFDWAEAADKIHQLQRMIMGQAAARAYPDTYRLLGETLRKDA